MTIFRATTPKAVYLSSGMKAILAFLMLVIFFSAGFGQENGNFIGVIKAKDTGEPLIGAHIKLHGDRSIGAATDLDGKFMISYKAGYHVFIISYTGMLTDSLHVTIIPGQTVQKEIFLRPYVNQLEPVEIKVGKFDRNIEDITVSMEVIKPYLIENKNTTNVKTILDYTPGLNILDDEPQIRGGSGFTFGVGSKVGIFVDDMPLLSGDAGRPYWNLIPVEGIQQIEVVKGCASVLSGANALSGAIYIRSASPTIEPKTVIRAYAGFYSTPKYKEMKWWNDFPYIGGAEFLHSRIIGNTDLVIGANINFDHGYIGAPRPIPTVVDTVTNFSDKQMASQRYRLNFKLRKRSKKTEGLNYGLNGNFMYDQSPLILVWLDDSSGFYRAYPGALLLQDNFTFYLDPFVNFYSNLGIKHSFKARVIHSHVDNSNDQSNRTTTYYADYNFKREYDFLKGFAFTGGLTFQYNDVYSKMYIGSGSPANHLLNLSAYAEFENNFFDLINFSIGARLEYFALNDSVRDYKPVFRAGATIKLLQETYLRMSVGQGYRFPTIAERYLYTNMGSVAVYNNPDLVPETSWNAEVGLKQGFKLAKFYGYIDFAAFQQEYQNTIEYLFGFWDPTFTEPAGFKFLNTGKSSIVGIDLSLTGIGKLGKDGTIRVLCGYNYIMPKTLQPDYVFATDALGKEFSYVTTSLDPSKDILKYRFLHTIKGDIQYDFKGFSTGVSAKYFSRIENLDKTIEDFEIFTKATGGSMQPIEYMDYFNNHNNGNFILDFRISYEFMARHKVAFISNNILNHWYSLRPLKAEQMRNMTVQYTLKM